MSSIVIVIEEAVKIVEITIQLGNENVGEEVAVEVVVIIAVVPVKVQI